MVAQRVALCLHQLPMMQLMHDGMLIKLFFLEVLFLHRNTTSKNKSENGEKLCFFDLQLIIISAADDFKFSRSVERRAVFEAFRTSCGCLFEESSCCTDRGHALLSRHASNVERACRDGEASFYKQYQQDR